MATTKARDRLNAVCDDIARALVKGPRKSTDILDTLAARHGRERVSRALGKLHDVGHIEAHSGCSSHTVWRLSEAGRVLAAKLLRPEGRAAA